MYGVCTSMLGKMLCFMGWDNPQCGTKVGHSWGLGLCLATGRWGGGGGSNEKGKRPVFRKYHSTWPTTTKIQEAPAYELMHHSVRKLTPKWRSIATIFPAGRGGEYGLGQMDTL